MSASPFTLNRFEYEGKHLYFLQPHLLDSLEQRKPIYLVGSRGTGKTTLLKSLDWRERLENEALRAQIDKNRLFYDWIGVYLKLPEFRFSALRNWLQNQPEQLQAFLFAFYLDLVWLQGLAEAIAELLVRDVLTTSVDQEHRCVQEIAEEFDGLFGISIRRRIITLREFARALRATRDSLEESAMLMASPAEFVKKTNLGGQVGDFGRRVGCRLSGLCCSAGGAQRSPRQYYFKICMDEGECLDSFQRKVVNTVIRLSKAPVFFVISFVREPPDLYSTLEHGLTLQDADRHLIPLDEMKEVDFRQLADGVASVRVKDRLNDRKAKFDSRVIFGELDINALLSDLLRQSVSPRAKEMLEDAHLFASQPHTPAIGTRKRRKITPGHERTEPISGLPIFEAYLAKRVGVGARSVEEPKWARRRQDSAEIRKKIVAAYLSICNDINTEPRYASADMLLQMSDMCVRDFLHQVDCVYRASKRSVSHFLEGRVPDKIQSAGLQEASREKSRSIPSSGVNAPSETGRVIRGLARLTARLQRASDNSRHLRSSERGLFWLSMQGSYGTIASSVLPIIREASEAGFLKLLREDEQTILFRVHASLAAAYGFSYRGAYYPIKLEWEDVVRLGKAKDEPEVDKISDEIGLRVDRPAGENLTLFGDKSDGSKLKAHR